MLPWGLALSHFPGGHAQEGLGKGVGVFLWDLTGAIWSPRASDNRGKALPSQGCWRSDGRWSFSSGLSHGGSRGSLNPSNSYAPSCRTNTLRSGQNPCTDSLWSEGSHGGERPTGSHWNCLFLTKCDPTRLHVQRNSSKDRGDAGGHPHPDG